MLSVRGLHKWTRGLLVASLVALGLAVPARAGNVIGLDPTGGGGVNPNNLLQASSFSWLPGNSLGIGGGGNLVVGQDVHVLYQAILGSINTTGANSAALGSNNGNITINGSINTGVQFVITAEFTEKVASLTLVSGVAQSVVFAPDLAAGVNSLKIYAQPSGNANINSSNSPTNEYPGAGATLILSGHAVAPNFTGSFAEDVTSDPRLGGTAVALNQHSGGSGSDAGITTITGSGNTSVTVAVDSYLAGYFVTGLPLFTLNFNTISTGLPFRATDPALKMYNGVAPNIGAINGVSGPDVLFQSQANNDFTTLTPEPGTIVMALTGIGIGALAGLRNLRRRNASLTA